MRTIVTICCGAFMLFSCENNYELKVIERSNKVLVKEAGYLDKDNKGGIGILKESVYNCGIRSGELKIFKDAKMIRDTSLYVINKIQNLKSNLTSIESSLDEVKKLFKDYYKLNKSILNQRKDWVDEDPLNELKGYMFFLEALGENGLNELEFKNLLDVCKIRILLTGDKCIKEIGKWIACADFRFDAVYPISIPDSKIIYEGESYIAKLILTSTWKPFTPTVVVEGKELDLESNWGFNTNFNVGVCPSDSSTCKKRWEGELKLNRYGEDTTIAIGADYYIRKPCK